jgi:hypothetical protein
MMRILNTGLFNMAKYGAHNTDAFLNCAIITNDIEYTYWTVISKKGMV